MPRFVSIVVPAYNEELTIVESLRALLALDYQPREIVIVNDGSTDGTLALLQETFQLVPAPLAFDQPLPSAPVRGVYRSVSEPDLVVVDKQNGGCKADAANAGINAASGVLVLVIDADTMLEADALSRAVLPFLEDPATVAVGGNVGIANGCRIEHGRVVDVALPRSWFARFQVVEYMRAFLLFRLACAVAECRRDHLGRIWPVPPRCGDRRRRLRPDRDRRGHRSHDPPAAALPRARRADPDRVRPQPALLDAGARRLAVAAVTALPLAPGTAPDALAISPDDRQSPLRHGGTRFPLPYIAFFEGLGPLLEVGGYVVTIVAAALGYLNWKYCGMMIAVSVLFGAAVTLLAVLLNDVTSRQYMRGRDLALLVAVAILESFGYRQLNSLWGCVGTVQALTGKGGWGSMKRKAFRT